MGGPAFPRLPKLPPGSSLVAQVWWLEPRAPVRAPAGLRETLCMHVHACCARCACMCTHRLICMRDICMSNMHIYVTSIIIYSYVLHDLCIYASSIFYFLCIICYFLLLFIIQFYIINFLSASHLLCTLCVELRWRWSALGVEPCWRRAALALAQGARGYPCAE